MKNLFTRKPFFEVLLALTIVSLSVLSCSNDSDIEGNQLQLISKNEKGHIFLNKIIDSYNLRFENYRKGVNNVYLYNDKINDYKIYLSKFKNKTFLKDNIKVENFVFAASSKIDANYTYAFIIRTIDHPKYGTITEIVAPIDGEIINYDINLDYENQYLNFRKSYYNDLKIEKAHVLSQQKYAIPLLELVLKG